MKAQNFELLTTITLLKGSLEQLGRKGSELKIEELEGVGEMAREVADLRNQVVKLSEQKDIIAARCNFAEEQQHQQQQQQQYQQQYQQQFQQSPKGYGHNGIVNSPPYGGGGGGEGENSIATLEHQSLRQDYVELETEHEDLLALLAQQEIEKGVLRAALEGGCGANAAEQAMLEAEQITSSRFGAYIRI